MRRIAAWLMAAALLPAVGQAQVRVGAVSEAGLGATAAPIPTLSAPALQLSAATLSPASLSPSLIAPAPLLTPAMAVAVAIQPAAAKLVSVTAKAVPAALAAIKPAAVTPDKPGSEQAREAGTALFDGAGRLSAPAIGDGPSVSGSAPEDRRSSGLSPPTESEITDAYRAARPQSRAIDLFGRDFVSAAVETMQKYTFMGDYFLEEIAPRGMMDFRGRTIFKAAEDLIKTHDAREDVKAGRFMELLGRWYAFQKHGQEKMAGMHIAMMRAAGRRGHQPHLPPSPIKGGEYWDMAAGMNAHSFIYRELEAGTKYTFFDYSPFVVSYLKAAAELAGAKNADVVQADLNQLTRPAKPLAVLRTKNAVHYVPGFDKKLEEMVDWIAPGGQLVIQNDPGPGQRSLIIDGHGVLIRRLLAEGWELEFGFSGYEGKFGRYALDTLILTRPKLVWEKSEQETARAWKSYTDAVRTVDSDFNPLSFLFR